MAINKSNMLIYIMVMFLSACSSSNENSNGDIVIKGSGDARYKVTFVTDWSATTHPVNFPANAHFSPVFISTHNTAATYWKEGGSASAGIKQMAELGVTAILTAEATTMLQQGNVDMYSTASGLNDLPTSLSISFPVKRDLSRVTIVSMLAPSTDWFVGVAGLDLYPNGVWVEDLVVDLYAYDAGTAGTSQNNVIEKIAVSPFLVAGNIVPVGRLIFNKLMAP